MRITSLLLYGSLALSTGCAYWTSTPVLAHAERSTFVNDDLPVPEGFRLDRSRSLRHQRSAYRRFKLYFRRDEYLGAERVVEYVQKKYPAAGWELTFQYGLDPVKFLFTKGSEECRVTVYEDFGDRWTDMVVTVEPRTTSNGEVVARASHGEEPDGSAETADTAGAGSSKK